MIRKAAILATAASGMAFAAAPASAETLDVAGTVAPYCNVSLSGVSSGTATVAMLSEQKIANLTVKCNAASGTKLVIDPRNGDLLSGNNRINYTFRLTSEKPEFNIAETDTAPGDAEGIGKFTTGNPGLSRELATGVPLDFYMNVNVRGEPQPDFAAPTRQFPAAAAPAGTYSETFSFTVTQV